MVVTEIGGGGIGVQMFQYASAYALSKIKNVDLQLFSVCDENVKTSFTWEYRLNGFLVENKLLSESEYKAFHRSRLVKNLEKLLPPHKRRKISWIEMAFDENFSKYPDDVILTGIRCGWKFLVGYEDEIRNVFTIRDSLDYSNQVMLDKIRGSESAFVHIRRGDYTRSPLHYALNIEYFVRTMRSMAESIPQVTFFVFSDDIEWCKSVLPRDLNLVYTGMNSTNSPVQDLNLMSSCKHGICSNSTFSWWAGFLIQNKEKQIVAPSKWFSNDEMNKDFVVEDFYPPEWQVLEPNA